MYERDLPGQGVSNGSVRRDVPSKVTIVDHHPYKIWFVRQPEPVVNIPEEDSSYKNTDDNALPSVRKSLESSSDRSDNVGASQTSKNQDSDGFPDVSKYTDTYSSFTVGQQQHAREEFRTDTEQVSDGCSLAKAGNAPREALESTNDDVAIVVKGSNQMCESGDLHVRSHINRQCAKKPKAKPPRHHKPRKEVGKLENTVTTARVNVLDTPISFSRDRRQEIRLTSGRNESQLLDSSFESSQQQLVKLKNIQLMDCADKNDPPRDGDALGGAGCYGNQYDPLSNTSTKLKLANSHEYSKKCSPDLVGSECFDTKAEDTPNEETLIYYEIGYSYECHNDKELEHDTSVNDEAELNFGNKEEENSLESFVFHGQNSDDALPNKEIGSQSPVKCPKLDTVRQHKNAEDRDTPQATNSGDHTSLKHSSLATLDALQHRPRGICAGPHQRCVFLTFLILLITAGGVIYILFSDYDFGDIAGNRITSEELSEEGRYSWALQMVLNARSDLKDSKQSVLHELETEISKIIRSSSVASRYIGLKILDLDIETGFAWILVRIYEESGGLTRQPDHLSLKNLLSLLVLRGTCQGAWSDNICIGDHFIGKYLVSKDSIVFERVCQNGQLAEFKAPTGFICSSNYSYSSYKPRERYEWVISAPKEHFIKLVFKHFETEKYYDVLSVYSGNETGQGLITRASGHVEVGRDIFITSNKAKLVFTSDGMIEKSGFFIIYHTVKNDFPPATGCSQVDVHLTSPEGGFTSARYPNQYPNGLRCRWTISIPENDRVIAFKIRDFKTRDAKDALRIFTSRHEQTVLFSTLFGSIAAKTIQTNSNFVVVVFTADQYMTDRGFHIDYFSLLREGCPGENECARGECYPDSFRCDGTYDCSDATDELQCESGCGSEAYVYLSDDSELSISSIGYPRNYGNLNECSWFIKAENRSHVVEIRLIDFSTEVEYDKLSIYDNIGRDKTLFNEVSGNRRPDETIVVPSANVTLQFTSDRSVTGRGFHLSLSAVEPGVCLGEHECSNGGCIPQSWVCDGSPDCDLNEDEENCDSGCGGPADFNKHMTITSPAYPQKYPRNSKCEWRIRAGNESKIVTIAFIDFRTENDLDTLSIYDGTGRNKTLRETYSGSSTPAAYESRGSSVTITFISDGSVCFRGFNISIAFAERGDCPGQFACLENECLDWDKVCDGRTDCRNGFDELRCLSGCGDQREIDDKQGSFSSLNYPGHYSDNLRCEWRIYGKKNELIQLELNHFDTERNFDKLLLFRGALAGRRIYVGYMSGMQSGTFYRSRQHQMSLVFVTDALTTRTGFNISYHIAQPKDLQACPGNSPVAALGMESRMINDSQIVATSSLSPRWRPSNARLNHPTAAWASSRTPTTSNWINGRSNHWLQVDLLESRLLTGLITQGFNSSRSAWYVKSYEIRFSKDGRQWRSYAEGVSRKAKVFIGNHDGYNIQLVRFNHPFFARFVRIVPREWTGQYIVMRLELLGCEETRRISLDDQDCGDDDIQCNNGTCVRREFACDGKYDCEDGTDENNCENCRSFQYQCTSGECILKKLRCNGVKDCEDGSDESGCSRCHGDDFLCFDESECLSRKRVCDGYNDCADFSDERNCSHPWLCPVRADYKCADGSCVSGVNSRCNGYTECADESDEKECGCGLSTKVEQIITHNVSTQSTSRVKRSEPKVRFTRIVGGQPAAVGSWPWQVSLEYSKNGDHFCGGVLVSEDAVLTAAHCLTAQSPKDLRVKVGLFYRTQSNFSDIRSIKSIHNHPRFDDQTMDFDIALIRLEENEFVNDKNVPICLPPPNHEFHDGQNCWVTGWGTLSMNGRRPEVLQEAELQLLSNEDCNRPLWYAGKITPRMLCAGDSSGSVDACKGDSGGPLVCKERSGRWFLAGIVSWGIGCGQAYKPGVYSRITELVHWIHQTMSEERR